MWRIGREEVTHDAFLLLMFPLSHAGALTSMNIHLCRKGTMWNGSFHIKTSCQSSLECL